MEKEERRKRRSASAERIKNAYNRESKVEVEVIETTDEAKPNDVPKEMKVCAYCRVSTEEESQQSSYELQVQHYTQYIKDHENWTLQGIYADEGISGTSVMHRKQFLQMIEECKEGKINLIVTKSTSRFARNVLDCISYVRQLKLLNPPVGVFFEMEGINSLDPNSEMILTILSIPCIKAEIETDQYESYLAIVPGQFLADIYKKHNASLLEANVRSFLKFNGGVNKGIRGTILNTPKRKILRRADMRKDL